MSRLVLAAVLLACSWSETVVAQATGTGPLPIFDVHLHAHSDNDPRFKTRAPNPVSQRPMTATSEVSHMRETLAEMERYNIRGVVSGDDYELTKRWKAAAPDRVIVSYSILNPTASDFEKIRTEHAAGRLQVIGEVGSQYAGLSPADPKLAPLFALAEELDIPVAYHMHPGPPGSVYRGTKIRPSLGNPLLLEEVLVRHPKLRIHVMHAGWPMLDQMIALMWAFPQVYVDTGVIGWRLPRAEFHSYLRRLVEAGFGQRILFGSDQMAWPDAIGLSIEAIQSATFLTDAQKRDLLYNNAARFLRLPDVQGSLSPEPRR